MCRRGNFTDGLLMGIGLKRMAAHGDMSRQVGRGVEIKALLQGEPLHTIPLCGMSSGFFQNFEIFFGLN
jgi:hypothetical protein